MVFDTCYFCSIYISVYPLDNTCIRISNMGGDMSGLYYRYSDTRYVNSNSTSWRILEYGYDNGWSGCQGNETYLDPASCNYPQGRWAWLGSDLSVPKVDKVNIWSKVGDTSGYISCGKYNIRYIVVDMR